jgi:hypothetical protein
VELILACALIAAFLIAAGVAAAVFNRAVLEPFVRNVVNKWFLWRGKPECMRVRYTAFDASGQVAFTAEMPTQALERIVAQMPGHAARVEVEGQVMELTPQSKGVSNDKPPSADAAGPAGA